MCICVLLCILKGCSAIEQEYVKQRGPQAHHDKLFFILTEHRPLLKQIPMYSRILKKGFRINSLIRKHSLFVAVLQEVTMCLMDMRGLIAVFCIRVPKL
jgi:hypothetical protein